MALNFINFSFNRNKMITGCRFHFNSYKKRHVLQEKRAE